MNWLKDALYTISYAIDTAVYWLGTFAYRIFNLVSDADIFDTDSAMGEITERI